jgi:hypothetical protein
VKTASTGTIFSGSNSSSSAAFSFSTDALGRSNLTVTGGSSGINAGAYFTARGREEAWFDVVATLNTAGLRHMRFGNSSNTVTNAFAIQLLNDAGTAVVSTPFRLQNAAPTNSFVIDAAGNVGLGVAVPSARLDVAGTVNATGLATLSGGITETGTASINTTGTAATTIGNTTAATAVTINTGSTGGLTLGGLTTATSSTDDVLIIGGTDKVSRISQANLVAGTTWALTGNEITTSSGALGAAPTGSFFGTRSTSTAKDVRIATNGLTRMIVAGDGSISMGGTLGVTGATTLSSTLGVTGATTLSSTLGVTGATTLSSTLGVTGATTLADLGGTASTSLPSGFDRLVIADTSGLLNEISIATLVGVSWQLTGNNLGAVTATLGSAPSGPYFGTTTGNTQDLQISMNNVVQAIIKTTGEMQLNKDMKVNDVVVGRGASSVASNTAIGAQALSNNSATGTNNTAVGNVALLSNTTGQYNTATGAGALYNNVDGSSNSGFGANALYNNQSGDNNVATGSNALYSNTLGDQNVAIGSATLQKNTIGNGNVALGHTALYNNLSGSNNVALGNAAGYNETGSNKLYIANSSSNNLIYGDFSTGTLSINAGSTPVAPGASLQVNAFNASTKGLIVKGAASATANLFEAQSSAGTSLTTIDVSGNVGIGTGSNPPSTSLDVDGGVTLRPGTVNVTADDQSVTVGNRSFLRVTSDDVPANRTITLSNGLQDGQILYLRVKGGATPTATYGVELSDSGNCNLSGLAQLIDGAVLQLIWDASASQWMEVTRSNN